MRVSPQDRAKAAKAAKAAAGIEYQDARVDIERAAGKILQMAA